VEFFLQCHRCHFFSWLERMLYVQLFTCWKCPTLVDLTHCIKHEVNPLLGSIETKKLTHLVYRLHMSSLLVISKNYIWSPFLDFHQCLFQELSFAAKINGKSFIGRCKKKVVIIIIPGKILPDLIINQELNTKIFNHLL
jgi:hypothetical protein